MLRKCGLKRIGNQICGHWSEFRSTYAFASHFFPLDSNTEACQVILKNAYFPQSHEISVLLQVFQIRKRQQMKGKMWCLGNDSWAVYLNAMRGGGQMIKQCRPWHQNQQSSIRA